MEIICNMNWQKKSRTALFVTLLSLSVFASGQNNPCDLNRDGVVDNADVALAVDMALGTTACTASFEGTGTCSVLTVQRVTRASRGQGCSVSNSFSIAGALSGQAEQTPVSARVAASLRRRCSGVSGFGIAVLPSRPVPAGGHARRGRRI